MAYQIVLFFLEVYIFFKKNFKNVLRILHIILHRMQTVALWWLGRVTHVLVSRVGSPRCRLRPSRPAALSSLWLTRWLFPKPADKNSSCLYRNVCVFTWRVRVLSEFSTGLTSAFRSERILTTHLLTAIWKVKLMTPRIFSKASSHRLLRLWDTARTKQQQWFNSAA